MAYTIIEISASFLEVIYNICSVYVSKGTVDALLLWKGRKRYLREIDCLLLSVMTGGVYTQFIDILVYTKFDFLYNKKMPSVFKWISINISWNQCKNWRV